MKKIRVAIIGVGNCASSLVQGVHFYSKRKDETDDIPGIMFGNIGGYKPTDIEFACAFEIDERKVGKSLREAIFQQPNCARVFSPDIVTDDDFDVPVYKGVTLDSVSEVTLTGRDSERFILSNENSVDVVATLKKHEVDIVLNYLPVGSQEATSYYASCAIDAKVSFINCIPVLTLNHPKWEENFINAGIPYIGSDMKSQFGASILSQILQELAFDRGMIVDYHQQLNVGGNMDFKNMLVQSRLKHKKISKENVIRAQNDLREIPVAEDALFAGPSTYIPYLKDNKVAYFNLRMRGFGEAEVTLDVKLSVQDSENSAGVVIDAIRFLKVAREMGLMGCLRGPSAFTQKSPPKQLSYDECLEECKALAKRELTANTQRQTNSKSAKDFAWEEYHNGGMDYLRLIEE